MNRDRILACLLLLVAFAGLVMQRIDPFTDIPWPVAVAVAIVAAASGLTGVWLWVRSSPNRASEEQPPAAAEEPATAHEPAGAQEPAAAEQPAVGDQP
ncbi:hypothetical protein ACN27F_31950 [Solwaraspora sp. WMMB335]|uniref:hypothetical protein n=1 Tax=Solwaraspora sp. WMMB335 TaxID=3404118 RepID=UPI003B927EC7